MVIKVHAKEKRVGIWSIDLLELRQAHMCNVKYSGVKTVLRILKTVSSSVLIVPHRDLDRQQPPTVTRAN